MSEKWKLSDYDTVDSRIKKFYAEHPDGRILTELQNGDPEKKAVFKAMVYIGDRQIATGWGYEERSASDFVNKDCWLENCETSAIGRALANMGYSGNLRPSQEEMKKVMGRQESKDVNIDVKKSELLELIKSDKLSDDTRQYIIQTTIPKIMALGSESIIISAFQKSIESLKSKIRDMETDDKPVEVVI